ncbi:MAG: cation diffusion facilitator family transporter [Steroidobacteraceae bacterium]
MSDQGSPARAILYAFLANLGIAIAKLAAAVFTGSGSMLAEAIHSIADCGNQVLLYVGLRQAQRPPDAQHPLGYGMASYFWSFVVALLLFSVGGLFSIYEGWHKLEASVSLKLPWVAVIVLGVSIVLETASLLGCLREIRRVRRGRSLLAWLRVTRNAELVVVLGEDCAALAGLVCALAFISIAALTGDTRFDAAGSILIGVMLVGVSYFIAVRMKSMLVGRSAEPDLLDGIRAEIGRQPLIERLFHAITLQVGPSVMLAIKIRMQSGLTIDAAAEAINGLERHLKVRFPEITWCFVEPDTQE